MNLLKNIFLCILCSIILYSCSNTDNIMQSEEKEYEIGIFDRSGDTKNPKTIYDSFVIKNLTGKKIIIRKISIQISSSQSYPLSFKKYCIKDIKNLSLCYNEKHNDLIEVFNCTKN